ncbi:MAG: metal-dependent hydrolase [Gemmatimonadaceae bacterium]
MDNLCHTLVGLALAEAGLKRRTALGTATLAIAANLPDVDVLGIPLGHSVDFRRGVTHGLPALVVLPVLLTGAVVLWDRLVRRRRGAGARAPVRPWWVLLLALVATLTHPLLDWLNNYGMRWLMPMSGKWYYGDAIYIVDPWLLVALLAGVLLSRRRRRADAPRAGRPARLALAACVAYIAAMLGLTAAGRWVVRRDLIGGVFATGKPRFMVGPRAVSPLDKQVVVDAGDRYLLTTLRLRPGGSRLDAVREVPKQLADSAARAALASPEGRKFARWSRFPFAVVDRSSSGTTVGLDDARYSDGTAPSFARVTVRFPALHAGSSEQETGSWR